MQVRDVITRDIITFKPDDAVIMALETFSLKNIAGAPVVENEKIVGIITEKDILKAFGRKHIFKHIFQAEKNKLEELSKLRVKDVMKEPVITITIDQNVNVYEAARMMNKYNINRLPVLEKGKLVGILTRSDIIKSVVKKVAQTKIVKKHGVVETDVDRLLKLVNKKGRITLKEVAEKMGVAEEDVEDWATVLDEHGLIEYFVPTFGKPELRKR